MPQRAARLKSALSKSRRTAAQVQSSYLRAEDTLTALEERESRRAERADRAQSEISDRMPATRGDRR